MSEQKHIIQKIGQNSFEFGPAKKRHKIYYEDAGELSTKIRDLKRVLEEEKLTIDFLTGEAE